MKIRYYTYNKEGIATKHYFLITAFIKCMYQSLLLGIDSNIDKCNHTDDSYIQIFYIKGWRPFI